MKIDRECIDHNVVRLTKDLTECVYDFVSDDTKNIWALITLIHIRGVIDLAEELKKVIDA